MTAKMKIMISKTNVRLDKAGKVLAIMVRISLRDFQDLASLNTLRSLKDRSIDRPSMPSASNSTNDRTTMTKSKTFHPSCKKNIMGNYCVFREGDMNLSDKLWLSEMLLNEEYLMRNNSNKFKSMA